jgi:L-lactate utilization protein LutC
LVKFTPGGNIYSDNTEIEKELKEILGLDLQHLVDERKRLIDNLKKEIESASKKNLDKKAKKALLNTMLKNWSTPKKGKYKPFCQVAIHYINKKLVRLS